MVYLKFKDRSVHFNIKNIVLCSLLHLWLPNTVIQHCFYSNQMVPYMDMTVPHKEDQEHRPRHSHTTCCPQMWVIHLIVEIKNCPPSMMTHGSLYWCTCYLPLLQWYSDCSTNRNNFPTTPLNNNCHPRPNAPYGNQI